MYLRDSGSPDLLSFQTSVRHRRVSFAVDEPICAATILKLDIGRIAEATTRDARMEMLWQSVNDTKRGIPDDIIFNEFPRLSMPGYRWAPSSFQQSLAQPARMLTNPSVAKRATLTDVGLRVSRPGWRIQVGSAPWAASGADWEILGGDTSFLHTKDQSGRLFSVSKSDPVDALLEDSLWTLLARARTIKWYILVDNDNLYFKNDSRRGILGFLQPHESGVQIFCSQIFVMIRALSPEWATVMDAAEKQALELQRHNTFRLYQLCHTCDLISACALAWLPTFIQRWVAALLKGMIGWWAMFHIRRFVSEIKSRGDAGSQSREVDQAMKDLGVAGSPISISGHIGVNFMGRFAEVTESFDSLHEWYVG